MPVPAPAVSQGIVAPCKLAKTPAVRIGLLCRRNYAWPLSTGIADLV